MQELSGSVSGDRRVLIVDDDAPLRNRLARAMEQRGFATVVAASVAEGVELGSDNPPAYAVVDLRLEDGNGMEIVQALRAARSDIRIVILTGYGNIATAVAAARRIFNGIMVGLPDWSWGGTRSRKCRVTRSAALT